MKEAGAAAPQLVSGGKVECEVGTSVLMDADLALPIPSICRAQIGGRKYQGCSRMPLEYEV